MIRWVMAPLLAGAAIGALSVLAFPIGRAKPSSAASGDINLVAIDMDVTGNSTVTCAGQGCTPGTLGTLQTCGEIPAVGGTLDVDIVVNSIPSAVSGSGAGPNIQGYDMDMTYNPAIVEVTALPANAAAGGPPGNLDVNYAGTPGGNHFSATDRIPDSDGDFFMSEVDFGTVGESGPGILMRLTLKGLAAGYSSLTPGYTLLGQSFPNIYDNSGSQNTYTIGAVQGATIVVGGTCSGFPATTPVTLSLSPSPQPTGLPPTLSASSSSNEGTPPGVTSGAVPESSGGSGSTSLIVIVAGAVGGLCVLLGAAFLIRRGSRKQ